MKKLRLNRETIRNLDPSDLGQVHGGTQDTRIPDCQGNCSEPPRVCITPTQCNEVTCNCNTVQVCINTYAPVC